MLTSANSAAAKKALAATRATISKTRSSTKATIWELILTFQGCFIRSFVPEEATMEAALEPSLVTEVGKQYPANNLF
jgi:hypothetical protein